MISAMPMIIAPMMIARAVFWSSSISFFDRKRRDENDDKKRDRKNHQADSNKNKRRHKNRQKLVEFDRPIPKRVRTITD